MPYRPSELDPYPRHQRDLAEVTLWERSLSRSRRRREAEERARRRRARRRSASLAVTTAMVAAPVAGPLAGARATTSSAATATQVDTASSTALLRRGSRGSAVAAVQSALGIPADGVFGPVTRRAVRAFQAERGLLVDGIVGPQTRGALFGTSTPTSTRTSAVTTSSATLQLPVVGTVTGVFGEARGGHTHTGVDLAVPEGTPVHAAGSGTVSEAGTESGYGIIVCIDHGGGLSSCYAHLSQAGVSVGQTVSAGAVIGAAGQTGDATGPHVHFEVRVGGTPVDPMGYVGG